MFRNIGGGGGLAPSSEILGGGGYSPLFRRPCLYVNVRRGKNATLEISLTQCCPPLWLCTNWAPHPPGTQKLKNCQKIKESDIFSVIWKFCNATIVSFRWKTANIRKGYFWLCTVQVQIILGHENIDWWNVPFQSPPLHCLDNHHLLLARTLISLISVFVVLR